MLMTSIFIVLLYFISFAIVDVCATITRNLDFALISHLNSKRLEDYSVSKVDCSDFFVPVHWAGAIAGALSCSLSHVLLLPIDVLKTKIQSGADATIHIRCIELLNIQLSAYILNMMYAYSETFLLSCMVLLQH